MSRDAQRAKVYAAEGFVRIMFDRAAERGDPVVEFFGTQLTLPPEARFGSVASVQTYADDVLALAAVRQRWPAAGPVRVRARRGATAAHYEGTAAHCERAGGSEPGATGAGYAPTGTIAVPDDRTAWALRELVVFFGHFAAVYGVRAEDSGVHRRYGRFPRITYRMPSWGSAIDRSMVATDCPGSAPA